MAFALAACGQPSANDLISAGEKSLGRGDAKAAQIELKSALQVNPSSGRARYLLGKALLKSADLTAAVVELGKAAELNYADAEVLPLLAKALLASGLASKVTDRFEQTVIEDPIASAELKASVAAAFGAQGMLDKSGANVEAALKLDPKNVAARLLQAQLVAGKGRMDDALRLLERVVAEAPSEPQVWQLKGEVLSIGKDDLVGGAEAFRKALEIQPSFLPAHTSLIALAFRRNDMPAFIRQVEELKSVLPKHPESNFYAAQIALLSGDIKASREIVQLLLRAAPNDVRLLQLSGAVELGGGALVLAVTHLNKALQFEPRLPVARQLLAQAHLRSGEPARALAVLRPLLEQTAPSAGTLAIAAEAHLQNGQFLQSEALFARAASLVPDDPKVRTALAIAQISKGDTQGGLANLEALTEKDAGAYADYALISARLRGDDLVGATRAVDRLSAKQPKGAMPHWLRGQVLLRQKNPTGARTSFEQALAADLSYYPAVASLVELDVAENRLDIATKRLEQQFSRDAQNYKALLGLVRLRQRTGESVESTRSLIADAVRANPSEVTPRVMLVDFLLLQKDVTAARAAAQEGVAAVPNSPVLMDALGRAQLAGGDYRQAVTSFGKVVGVQPESVTAHLRLAEAHVLNKDMSAASRSLQRALEVDPKALPAQIELAKIAVADKRVDDGLAIARVVQKQRPTEPVGFLMEGEILASQLKWAPSLAAYQSALTRGRSTATAIRLHAVLTLAGKKSESQVFGQVWMKDNPKDAAFLSHLGSLAMEKRDYAATEAYYLAVLAIRPDDIAAHNNLAFALIQQGKKGSVQHAERANKLAPEQPAIMDTLAMALAAEGRLAEALDLEAKVLAKATEDAAPAYRLNMAKLYLRGGNQQAARAELNKLAYMGNNFDQQAEVTELLRTLK